MASRLFKCAFVFLNIAFMAEAAPVMADPQQGDDRRIMDCHFGDDEDREFVVDDAGGQGVGYSFSIDLGHRGIQGQWL